MGDTVNISASERRANGGEKQGPDLRLRLTVVFTTTHGTVSALCAASEFAKSLEAWIALVALEAVPVRLPLEQPPVPVKFLERRLLGLVSQACVDAEAVSIQVCLCRDRAQCLQQVLQPRSLVVLGGNRGRWSAERKLEERLTKMGHRVILVDAGWETRTEPGTRGSRLRIWLEDGQDLGQSNSMRSFTLLGDVLSKRNRNVSGVAYARSYLRGRNNGVLHRRHGLCPFL